MEWVEYRRTVCGGLGKAGFLAGSSRPMLCWVVGLVCGLSLATTAEALDFQLHPYQVNEDGFTWERNYFLLDAQHRVAITLPAGWSNVGSGPTLTMTPPSPARAQALIEKSALTPQIAFKDKGLDAYRQRVIAAVPSGATNVGVAEERDNAFPFFGWTGYEFVLRYDYFGQTFQRSLLFVNVSATEQILATSVAPKENFKKVHAALLDVVRSWQPLAEP